MKKIVLMMMFILVVIVGLYGTIKINEKGNTVSQHNDMDISGAGLGAGDKIFETVKSNTSALSYGGDSEKLGYLGDDLVYREYSWGYRLEKGYKILIEHDQIIGEVEDAQTLVVFCNNSEYKEFAFDGNDIEFEIDKSGNYSFYAIDSDGNSFDIMSIVKAYKSADRGAMPL